MNAWQARSDDYSLVQCAILYGLESGLQRCFERHGPYEMFQELMVNKTTSFKKKTRERKGTSRIMANKLPLPGRNPKLDLSLKLSASTAKGVVTGSGTAPNT